MRFDNNTIPPGVRVSDFTTHPVRRMLQDAAARDHKGMPSPAELDALKLSPTTRAALRAACKSVADRFAEGEMGEARELADQHAGRLIGDLPEEKQSPDYLAPDRHQELAGLNPAQLAALVPRRF